MLLLRDQTHDADVPVRLLPRVGVAHGRVLLVRAGLAVVVVVRVRGRVAGHGTLLLRAELHLRRRGGGVRGRVGGRSRLLPRAELPLRRRQGVQQHVGGRSRLLLIRRRGRRQAHQRVAGCIRLLLRAASDSAKDMQRKGLLAVLSTQGGAVAAAPLDDTGHLRARGRLASLLSAVPGGVLIIGVAACHLPDTCQADAARSRVSDTHTHARHDAAASRNTYLFLRDPARSRVCSPDAAGPDERVLPPAAAPWSSC